MKHKLLLLLAALCLTGMGTLRAQDVPAAGQDSQGYWQLATAQDIVWFSNFVNQGGSNASAKARLIADIDMTGINLFPIGMYANSGGTQVKFSGQFDGQGHVIKNLYQEAYDYYELGLFSRTEGATLENFGVINATIIQHRSIRAGVIGGEIYNSTVRNVFTGGEITVQSFLDEGAETISDAKDNQIGGIAGESNSTTMTDCYTTFAYLSNPNASNGSFVNCYQGEEKIDDSTGEVLIPAVTKEQAASGEFCVRLNAKPGSKLLPRPTYYQNLGEDPCPVMNPEHKRVYASGNVNCGGDLEEGGTWTFSNTQPTDWPAHDFDGDGLCMNCGADQYFFQPAEDGWYEVTTGEQMRYVSRLVNAGTLYNGIKIRLMNNIDMSNVGNFPPIGEYNDNGTKIGFRGEFDGQKHIISNLNVFVDNGQEAGFFGRVNNGGYIHDFGIINADITNAAAIRAGVVAGEIHAVTVNRVFTAGSLSVSTSHNQAGGISGEGASTTFNDCYTTFDGVLTNGPGALNRCYSGADVAEQAPTGALAWRMNGNTFQNPLWFQNLEGDADECPVLDPTHGIVYKVSDEEYASATTAEEFQKMIETLINVEKAEWEEAKASANLITTYLSELDQLKGLGYEEFLTAYDNLAPLREALNNSLAAYKAYQDKVDEVKQYLATHDDFSGEDRDNLVAYLSDSFNPGENELFPNGSYSYIIEECQLNNNVIKQETAYVQELLDIAIARGYGDGAEVTNKLANANLADGFNGWTTRGNNNANGQWGETYARQIQNGNPSYAEQTLGDLKPGLYEFQMSSYTELSGWTSPATYNYGGGFIYANGAVNHIKTQGAELMSEETYETLTDDEKSHLRAIANPDEMDVVLGYKPGDVTGVAIMFSQGVWNNRVVVNIEDSLTVGMTFEGAVGRTNDMFLGAAKLRYLGTMDSQYVTEALDAELADMVAAAKHIVYDYVADYYAMNATDAPNFTKSLADELKEAIAAAGTVSTNADKYALTQTFGNIFQGIWESKKIYTEMAQLNESVMHTCEDVLGDDPAAFNKFVEETYEPIMALFENGSASNAEVEAKIEELKSNHVYQLQQGEEPEEIDGVYQIANAYNLIWFSYQSNNGRTNLNAVLTNDIDMKEVGNFTPIARHRDGSVNGDAINTTYSGTFDGQGHVIKNLTVKTYDGVEAGFFSRCQGATVRNLGFENATVENLWTYGDAGELGIRAGVLAGEFYMGLMENCWSTDVKVETIHEQKGGIAGESAQSTLRGCWTTFDALSSGGTQVNCFAGLDVEELTPSGALCFLLNGEQETIAWYQTKGEDKYPTLDSTHKQIYAHGGLFCDGMPKPETTFTNEYAAYEPDAHQFGEDGICTVCGYNGATVAPVDGWYDLASALQLRWFANFVNAGNTGAKARLVADIDLENKPFFPIGIYSDAGSYQGMGNQAFNGTFDGQGHVIKNLNVEGNGNVELALFSRASTSAQIRNLGIINAKVVNTHPNDGKRIGVLCGEANGTIIENCFVVGDIVLETTHTQKAAFAGEAASGTVRNCFTTYDLISNQGTLSNCFAGKKVVDGNNNVIVDVATTENLASGEVCHRLNGGEQVDPVWFQTIGEDAYPVLDDTHKIVYKTSAGTYTNVAEGLALNDGSEENPFRIHSAEEFCSLIDYLRPGKLNKVVLENDIDMDAVTTWIPLNCDQAVAGYANWIDFDGQNHVIKNFHPANTDQSYQSIFGIHHGSIRNLGVENADLTCTTSGTGILTAWLGRTASYSDICVIDHCWVTGKLNAAGYAGALAGHTEGEAYIRNCYANVEITSTSALTGGIVGRVRGKLQMDNVYAAGSHNHGGGIIGGGQQAATPACTYNNIVVWNNYFENFGETAAADKMTNVKYYNKTNFAELQQAVVAWDSNIWSCGMGEGEYPVLIGTGSTSIAMPKLNIASDAIYTLTGVKVGNDLKKLPKGIYIINGKKVLVK